MATSTIRDDVFIWSNLLTASVVFQALTWVFQIMPLFFFAGVAACVDTWHPGDSPASGPWGNWLMRRCTRLYRPVFYYLAFWVSALAILRYFLPEHVYEPVAGISIQLLWFLGAYVLVLAAVPLLARITTTGRLIAAVAGTYAFIAVVDAVRINVDGLSALGYLNLVAWLIPGMLGVAYRRRLLAGRAALMLGAVMFAVNLALMWLGPYELSLVGIETQQLKNMTPPSLLLAGHAIMMCAFAIAAAPAIARWAQRPRVWWLTAIGNSGAMTLYLWHIPALLVDASGLRLPRPSALRPDRSRLHRAQRPAAGHHGHPGCGGVRRAAPAGEQPAATVGRRLRGRDRFAQRRGRRPAVRGRCGHAGIGRLGSQRPGALLRRG